MICFWRECWHNLFLFLILFIATAYVMITQQLKCAQFEHWGSFLSHCRGRKRWWTIPRCRSLTLEAQVPWRQSGEGKSPSVFMLVPGRSFGGRWKIVLGVGQGRLFQRWCVGNRTNSGNNRSFSEGEDSAFTTMISNNVGVMEVMVKGLDSASKSTVQDIRICVS